MVQSIHSWLEKQVVERLYYDRTIGPISKKCLSLKTNSERTLYVYGILKNLKVLPEKVTIDKSESLSEKYRELGNNSYKKSKNYEALQYYNMSLQHAPRGATQLSLAYANRSAVLLTLKRYNECLKDIETVFSMNYPDKLKNKLLNRQQQCRAAAPPVIKDKFEENIGKILKGMPSKNPQYICASSKVAVLNSKEMGRHVVAVDNIEPGEIIAEEEPYVSLLNKSKAQLVCSYCFSFSANLMPCDKCCFVLFCSETCKSEAAREYHSIECSIGATLIAMGCTGQQLLALRTTIKARRDQPDWKSLLNLIDKVDKDAGSAKYGLVEMNGSLVYDSKSYNSIHTLATNSECMSRFDSFLDAATAAVLLHFLSWTEFLREGACGMEAKVMGAAGGLLMQHLMTSTTNMHAVGGNCVEHETCGEECDWGSALYAFLSLINHSCAPNVERNNRLGSARNLLIALRPIKKGCQLFDDYGCHYGLHEKSERQARLERQYKFKCICEACEQDWPLHSCPLPPAKFTWRGWRTIRTLGETVFESSNTQGLRKFDLNTVLKVFRPLCDLTNAIEAYAPGADYRRCQANLSRCLLIIFGICPSEYSNTVDWVHIVMKNLSE